MAKDIFMWGRWSWSFSFRVGPWYMNLFLKPTHWAIDYHRNTPCCKFWLLIGPFEINRVWTDAEYEAMYPDLDNPPLTR